MERYTDHPEKQWQNDVVFLAKKGMRPSEIALRMSRPVSQVYAVIGFARKKGWDIPRHPSNIPKKGRSQQLTLKHSTYEVLRPFAHARGLTPGMLAKAIIERVVCDDLVAAVLDDEVATTPGPSRAADPIPNYKPENSNG